MTLHDFETRVSKVERSDHMKTATRVPYEHRHVLYRVIVIIKKYILLRENKDVHVRIHHTTTRPHIHY